MSSNPVGQRKDINIFEKLWLSFKKPDQFSLDQYKEYEQELLLIFRLGIIETQNQPSLWFATG